MCFLLLRMLGFERWEVALSRKVLGVAERRSLTDLMHMAAHSAPSARVAAVSQCNQELMRRARGGMLTLLDDPGDVVPWGEQP